MKTAEDIYEQTADRMGLAFGEQLLPDQYPRLFTISPAFFIQGVIHTDGIADPEYVYVPIPPTRRLEYLLAIHNWNCAWEAGHLRTGWSGLLDQLPTEVRAIVEDTRTNWYLVPLERSRYPAYAALFHLLPLRLLRRFGLPPLHSGVYPPSGTLYSHELHLTRDFDDRLARAFAAHVWPRIESGSGLDKFSSTEPLKLLAHNLDFWLPHAGAVLEDLLRTFPRTEVESTKQQKVIEKARAALPDGFYFDRPRMGGDLWRGEQEAAEVTRQIVERADQNGRLRQIVDAVRSNRVEDDFSSRWSYAREDFERKLYRKRQKIKVAFVELTDSIPVHGPDAELDGNVITEEFLTILDTRQREIVVLLNSGFTQHEVATRLGYANHSPISKALNKIRREAASYFGDN